MPVYRIQSPAGREVEIEGDAPPSDSDLDEIFAGLPEPTPAVRVGELAPSDIRGYLQTPRIEGLENFAPENPTPALTTRPPTLSEDLASLGETVIGTPLNLANRAIVGGLNLPTTIGNKLRGQEEGMIGYREPSFSTEKPLIKLAEPFKPEEVEQFPPWLQKLSGIYNATAEGVNELMKPQNVFAAPLLASKAVAKPFMSALLANVALSEPAAIERAVELSKNPDATDLQKGEAWGNAAIVNPAFGALLAAGIHGGKKGAPETPAVSPEVEAAAIKGGTPQRQLGIKMPETLENALANPEVRTIVDQAIKDTGNVIVQPGKVSPLELLRRQQQEIAIEQPTASKIQGGGEAIGGKLTFNRPAIEQAEGRTLIKNRQEVEPTPSVEEQGPREVPQSPPRGSPIFRPTPGEFNQKQLDFQKRKQRESVEAGLYLEQPEFKTEIPEPPTRQYPPEGMGTGVLSNAQRRKALARERARQKSKPEIQKEIASEQKTDADSIRRAAEFFNDNVAEAQAATASEIRQIHTERLKGAYGSIERVISELEKAGIPAETEYRLLDKVDRELNRRGEQPPPAGFSPQDILSPKTQEAPNAIQPEATRLAEIPSAEQIRTALPEQVVEWKRRVKYGPETSKAIADKITDSDALAMVAERDALRDQANAELRAMQQEGRLDPDRMAKAQEISLKAQTLNEIIQDRVAKTLDKEIVKSEESGVESKPDEQNANRKTNPPSKIRELDVLRGSVESPVGKPGRSELPSVLEGDTASKAGPNLRPIGSVESSKQVEARQGGGGGVPETRKKAWQMTKAEALEMAAKTGELRIARNRALNKAFQDRENPAYRAAEDAFNKHRERVISELGIKGQNYNKGMGLDSQQMAERLTPQQAESLHIEAIKKAIKDGKMIPQEVINDYPRLKSLNPLIENRAALAKEPPTQQPESAAAASLETPASTVVPSEAVTPKVTEGKSVSEIIESGVAAIERLQKKLRSGAASGDTLMGVPSAILDTALEIARLALKGGKTVAQATELAAKHIRHNVKGFDENKIMSGLQSVLKDEGLVPTARTPQAKAAEVPAKAGGGIEAPEGQKVRSLSARGTVSEKIPEAVQEQIKTDPRSVYSPQNVPETVAEVSKLDSSKLAAMGVEDARFTASKLELMDRLFKAGDSKAAFDVFQETSEKLTKAGQIINQAKLLNALKPEVQVSVINETLKKAGKDPLTEAQTNKGLELGRANETAKGELDAATKAWLDNPTPENAKIAEDALIKANNAALEVQKFANAFQPRFTSSLLKSILQGNLLTPISQTANLVGNLSFLPFRATARGIAAALDASESAITGRKRTSSVGPITGTTEAAKGLASGAKKIPSILKQGTGNTVLGETRQGLNPIKAWMNQFASNPEMATKGGKITAKDRMNLLIEGTLGIPAETMLRLLGAVDQPFREAAKARVTANELRNAKVPQEQWAMAQKFPELFFDKETLARIQEQSDAAVFQRRSKTLNHLTQWIASKGPVADFAVATVAPYKLTPWNIIGEILSYNPVVAFGRGAYEAAKGNRRAANLNAGKLVVGGLLTTAAYQLYKNGLLSPSLDSKDETMKERIAMGQVMPPNHINIDGLKRWMNGGSPDFQPGDKTVDVMRSGGLAGAFMYMTANVGRDLEKSPEAGDDELWKKIITQSTLEQARFGMNQSFLSGVEGLLSAIKDGNAENYISKLANTVTSIPLPNTLSALSRATREAKPDFSDKKIEGVLRNKLGIFGADDNAPIKRGLWGEPLKETPTGRSPLAYQLLDVTKGQQITSDPKTLEIYRLWRKTDDSKVIPTPVSDRLTIKGSTYMLTPEQQSRLAELVGQKRAEITDSIVTNVNWLNVPDEVKIKMLERVYEKGLEYGKGVFFSENQGKLTQKPAKAGFKQ